jgi:ketosteroid isomerase-like protein
MDGGRYERTSKPALIQSVYASFGRGDIQYILDRLTSGVEWTLEGPEIIPFAGHRHGVSQVVGFFEALATTQTSQKLSIADILAQGDLVATFGRYAATVTATGKSFDSPVAHLFRIHDGKISSFLDVGETASMAGAYQAVAAAAK